MTAPARPFTAFLGTRAATNASLTAVACLLGLVVASGGQHTAPLTLEPAAMAQEPGDEATEGRISAAEQRKQIISELKSLQSRLDKIDAALSKGISVRVTEMPARELDRQSK